MTLTDISRKRNRALSRPRVDQLKLPRLSHWKYMANLEQVQTSSSTNTNFASTNIRLSFQRGISSIKSIFKSRASGSDTTKSENTTQALVISQNDGQGGFGTLPAISGNPLRLRLTATPSTDFALSKLVDAVVVSTEAEVTSNSSLVSNSSGLRRKISTKFLQSFHNPATVLVKPELRSRPSVQDICNAHASNTSSTLSTQSSASTTQFHYSSPLTSDSTNTGSPNSVQRHELDVVTANDQILVLFNQRIAQRKLSTIEEIDGNQIAIMKTIEATAAAK